jgi:hypothetical protein
MQAKRVHTKTMKMTQKSGNFSTVLADASYAVSGHMHILRALRLLSFMFLAASH